MPFDLVLMDLEMPGSSGIDATRELRSLDNAMASIPVIAVTAHALPERREDVMQAGLNDLLAKPYLPEELFAIIDKWSGRRIGEPLAPQPSSETPVLDEAQTLTPTGDDPAKSETERRKLLDSLAEHAGAIRFAIAESDYETLYRVAKRLIAVTPLIDAPTLGQAARMLTDALKTRPRPRDRIESGVADILREMGRLQDHQRVAAVTTRN
jgi:CheY-like chemotaxis protein